MLASWTIIFRLEVYFVFQILKPPISVAKKVLTDTPHVMLAGKGAFDFALSKGFVGQDLLTPDSKKEFAKWAVDKKYKPVVILKTMTL